MNAVFVFPSDLLKYDPVMSFPEIPVITIKRRGEVCVPTLDNIQGGIDNVLSNQLPVFAAGTHRLFSVAATRPHHPTAEHTVYWVDSQRTFSVPNPWNDRSWIDAVTDSDFIFGLEQYFRQLQKTDPQLSVYSFMGFVPPGTSVDTTKVYDFGAQSQARWHWHATHRIDKSIPYSRILSIDDEHDRRRIAAVLNLAGESSIKQFSGELSSFGERLVYRQQIGLAECLEVTRTIFGFPSLHEAVNSALSLQYLVKKEWLDHAYNLAQQSTSFAHVALSYVQSCVPNMTILLPSRVDVESGKVDSENQFWVVPFSVSGAQSILAPGGVFIQPEP